MYVERIEKITPEKREAPYLLVHTKIDSFPVEDVLAWMKENSELKLLATDTFEHLYTDKSEETFVYYKWSKIKRPQGNLFLYYPIYSITKKDFYSILRSAIAKSEEMYYHGPLSSYLGEIEEEIRAKLNIPDGYQTIDITLKYLIRELFRKIISGEL